MGLWKRMSAPGLSICGVEKTDKTGRLARLNLAIRDMEAGFAPEYADPIRRDRSNSFHFPNQFPIAP